MTCPLIQVRPKAAREQQRTAELLRFLRLVCRKLQLRRPAIPLNRIEVRVPLESLCRKSGLAAVASGASSTAKLVADAPSAALGTVRKLALIRSTLSIRHLDSRPETLVASALADAERRGLERVTIFFSHPVEPATLSKLLDDGRVASLGTQDAQFANLLPSALLSDARSVHTASWAAGLSRLRLSTTISSGPGHLLLQR